MNYDFDQFIPIGTSYETDSRDQHPGYVSPMPMVPYRTYPLGQLPPAAPLPGPFSLANVNVRQVLLVIAVVAVVAVLLWQLMKLTRDKGGAAKVERNAVVSRLSTKELAQRLYDRLESKGSRTNTATMRSLERLSR